MVITGCIEEKPAVEKSDDYKPEFSNRTLMTHANNTAAAQKSYETVGKKFNAALADVEDAGDVYNLDPTPENANELNRKIHILRSVAIDMQVEEKAYDAQLTTMSNYLDDNREELNAITKHSTLMEIN
ncbi:hypothetical protein FXV91_18150 [Methanosarcina sp. DH2]|jgi:hypothetical protein|uniref:hypothetical protein n=1 Tax=Methanosarcina sp. DH2 TaxID=2605639 RepID=UPI001E43DD27|nr:hypothetical protein [Methanosarcina sp. DH2]MCC4772014.1 hypothetical protein [Methanosarcina sp. DH2]